VKDRKTVNKIGSSWKAKNPKIQGDKNRNPVIHCLRVLTVIRGRDGADARRVRVTTDMAAPEIVPSAAPAGGAWKHTRTNY
jgi:hypothetical protein